MSASLVGSEMCIRDSGRASELYFVGASPGRALSPVPTKGQDPVTSVRVPVSYTHLTLPTICSV
eukprot:9254058-Alexandrium_andersonii.AAC.1